MKRNILHIALLLLCPLLSVAQHSLLSEGSWLKIGVEQTGVYVLTCDNAPALQGARCSGIALYGGDARQRNETDTSHQSSLAPYACQIVDRNGNGRFDGSDALYFYAEGVTTWRREAASDLLTHQRHAYSQRNYLFLRTDSPTSLGMESRPYDSNTALDVSTFTLCGVYEQESINTHHSGQVWVSDKLLSGNSKSLSVEMPCAVKAPLQARLALVVPDGLGRFSVACEADRQEFEVSNREHSHLFAARFNHATPTFQVDYQSAVAGYIDYVEVNASAQPVWNGGSLLLHTSGADDAEAIARHQLSTSGQLTLAVWDVTQPQAAVEMEVRQSGSTLSFTAPAGRRDYVVFAPDQCPSPLSISTLPNQDLMGAATPDMVIVTHPQFLPQSQRLALLHETIDHMEVLVVTQDQVFNEFSSGKRDPLAIRALMSHLSSRGDHQPKHLLLFGKGTYDNRDLLGSGLPTAVTYQSPTSFTTSSEYSASDDIYGPYSIGRLPARSTAEADRLVDKIERYMLRIDLEDNTIRGDWRTYVTLLADDADPSQAGDVEFASSSEYLAHLIEAQAPWINLDKIYADAYQQQSGTIGSYYPDVNNALKQRMDYGCLLLNYIGHGSDQYIGTERYMEPSDIEGYRNLDRLPFFVTSTCSFGKFDKMDGLCGSEAFVLASAAGVACVAAARPISHMRAFNSTLSISALQPGNTIGEALLLAKQRHPMSQNVSIAMMGDPALKLCFPEHEVVVTAINGRPVEAGQADSAKVLSRVTVTGEVRNHNGLLQSDFDGVIYPIVFDRKQTCHTLANDNEGTEIEFTQQKNVLYKGRDTVVGGRFEYSFIVPRDVAYQYAPAKLNHYAKSAALGSDAAGAYNRLYLGGFDETADISETRPDIRLFMGDTTFLPGGITDPNATLLAMLYDSIGINSVGSGLGHDITALLDNNANDLLILNDFYETDVTNPDLGYIRYQFANLTPGRHTLTLKAWNIYNYSAEASIDFVVRSADSLTISQLRPYPNPTTGMVTLQVNHNCPNIIQDARIEIYDLRGSRITALSPTPAHDSYSFSANCDLRQLSDGIYLARAVLTLQDGQMLTESTKIVKKK